MTAMTLQEKIDLITEPSYLRRAAMVAGYYRNHPSELAGDFMADLADFAHFCRALARLLRLKLHAH